MEGKKTVAIIGGGPCGILSAKHIAEEGLVPTLFEMTNDIGGQWNQGSQMSGMWRNLVANSPKGLNNLSQLSLDDDQEIFTSCYKYQDYLKQYLKKFDLEQYIQLNTKVIKVSRNKEKKTYIIQFQGKDEKIITKEFNFVVLATGRYNKPYTPNQKDNEIFKGEIYHSFDYDRIMDNLPNKKVLIVGSSISSIEICQHLADKASKVINSSRKSRYIVPKIVTNYPIQYSFFSKFYTMIQQQEPMVLGKIYEDFKNQHLGNLEDAGGIKRDSNIFKAGIGIGQYYAGQVSEGRILERTGIKQIKENSVIFEDGKEEEIDAIVYCTGFEINLDIVDEDIKKDLIIDGNDKFLNIYKYCMHPKLNDFSVMGIMLITGTGFTPLELASRLVSMVFSGKKQLPSQEEIDQEQEKHIKWASTAQYVYPMDMTEDLSTFIGCRPVYENHPEISKALFFGPNFSEQFRLDGYGKDPNAKQAYINSLKANKVQIQVGDYTLSEFQEEMLQKLLQKQPQNQELLQLQKIFKFKSLPSL